MAFPPIDQAQILQVTKDSWKKVYASTAPYRASCLQVSLTLRAVLDRYDPKCRHVLQAGSASWLAVPDELDDGVSPTHFAYEFDKKHAMINILQGRMPEMHCWVARIGSAGEVELIDALYGFQPEQLKNMKHIPDISIPVVWHESLMPKTECLWCRTDLDLDLPVRYEANAEAIKYAHLMAAHMRKPIVL